MEEFGIANKLTIGNTSSQVYTVVYSSIKIFNQALEIAIRLANQGKYYQQERIKQQSQASYKITQTTLKSLKEANKLVILQQEREAKNLELHIHQ